MSANNEQNLYPKVKFSVLISVYFKEKQDYLRQSLESIFEQTFPPSEVVLVEDGELTEELYNVISSFESRYKQLKRVRLEFNSGLGISLNEGLKHCSYELVARMDSDDICFPNRFEKQISFMNENPDIDISGTWIQEFEGSISNIKSIKKVPSTSEEISSYIKYRNPLNHPTVIFRKKSVTDAGSYKHFPLFEDWYLWARMMKNGARFANIQESLLHFRVSPDMFRRRGGGKYALYSARFQWTLHKLGLTSSFSAIKASILRGGVYMLPNILRRLVYSKLLRF